MKKEITKMERVCINSLGHIFEGGGLTHTHTQVFYNDETWGLFHSLYTENEIKKMVENGIFHSPENPLGLED